MHPSNHVAGISGIGGRVARRARRLLAALVLAALGCAGAGIAQATSLVWTDTWYGAPRLYRARLDGSFPSSLPLPAGSLPEGLAFDRVTAALFLGEAAWSGAFIRKTDAALAPPSPFVAGPSCVRGLAMDEPNGLLFWSTSNLVDGCSIRRATRAGVDLGPVVTLGTAVIPHGVAVDPGRQQVWWTDSNLHAVARANYDGSGAGFVFSCDPLSFPYGIAFDPATDRVYWTEYNAGRLLRSNRDGSGRTVLLTGLNDPTHLALDAAGGRLYWVDGGYGQGRVHSCTTDGNGVTELAALQSYGGVAIVPGPVTDVPPAEPGISYATALLAPWPNPGPGFANVAFTLATAGDVRVTVHDVAGRRVAVLANGAFGPGPHTLRWSAGDRDAVPPGVYFVRMHAGGREWTRRLVLAR